MGPPMPGAKEALEALRTAGHTILIHSCLRPSVIADWMAYYRIPYSSIWQGQGKPVANYYLDDRAIRFEAWTPELLEQLNG